MSRLLASLIILFFVSSCEKSPGEGGTSTIQGSVYKLSSYYNVLTQQTDTVYYQLDAKKDVYIIYSDNENDFYNDNIETNWNGQYRFDYLRKGDYTLFVYTDSTDALNISYDYPIFKHVKIDANNSTFTLPDFVINE